MTRRAPCPPAPIPLEAYVQQCDDRFASLAQRGALRDYLHGLLLPRERHKTLTGLAGTEADLGAQAPPAQRRKVISPASTVTKTWPGWVCAGVCAPGGNSRTNVTISAGPARGRPSVRNRCRVVGPGGSSATRPSGETSMSMTASTHLPNVAS